MKHVKKSNINYASENLVNILYKCINLCFFPGPFQITVILVLLYKQMQLAIIPGIALLLLMIPINLFLQKILKNLTVCMYDRNRFNFLNFYRSSLNK